MTGKGPLNYTTKCAADKTAMECVAMLGRAGADSVAVHWEGGNPEGLSFALQTPHGKKAFTLPVNVDGARKMLAEANERGALRSDGHKAASMTSREHASRVAWRVAKDWLEAALALVAARMATLDEVMLPYIHMMIDGEDTTFYEHYRQRGQRALEA